jgi:hypothetical protein
MSVNRLRVPRFFLYGFLVCCQFPFLAFSIGPNSNISFAVCFALLSIISIGRLELPHYFFASITVLVTCVFIQVTLLEGSFFRWQGLVQIMLYSSMFFASALAAYCIELIALLKIFIYFSFFNTLFVVFQLFFFQRNQFLFPQAFNVNGLNALFKSAENWAQYVKRPMGWFPEPSYMAFSLSLMLLLSVLLFSRLTINEKLVIGRIWRLSFWTSIGTIILSQSAIAPIAILTILMIAIRTKSIDGSLNNRLLLTLVPIMSIIYLLVNRLQINNFSWSDRISAATVSLRHLIDTSIGHILFGFGRDSAQYYFKSQALFLDYSTFTESPEDIFSTLFRFVFEFGILGLTLFLFLSKLIYSALRNEYGGSTAATISLFWLIGISFFNSYDSSAWIWLFPGLIYSFFSVRRNHARLIPNK